MMDFESEPGSFDLQMAMRSAFSTILHWKAQKMEHHSV